MLGAMIGQLIDRKKAKKNPPAHLDDPEIVELGDKALRALPNMRMPCFLARAFKKTKA